MFALLLKHQLWPTSQGQNHMLALLLTHQLWPSSGDVRADSAAPRRAAAANAVVNSNFALQMREGAAVIKAPAPSGAEVATQASQSSSPCKID